ncbi:exonuclease domain-containing protein [Corynebacterium cystitidis]|uniref:DNA polymerase-3 subunit epsilon n=1 Tax=Corynebacterium cystitidis DSM 20524 TaxID=1121357 RepID=A0A1H9NU19_9CORY|nr:exonuclease domain-containing protein [Corynebacterium cystitidis]WJY82742.1 DNA polymerase III PolC-type [Corynebacterium cystitidis DSM 20524]SER39099.1 DNA polymerase-3 subunit epsilon [Corynebacterium cystitidis DSM 20524]SNV71102.1 DNA polymerase III epsilon subunit [Corynebacterium cystitidis]
MIAAHGATVTVTNTTIRLTPTELAASLSGSSGDVTIAVDELDDVTVTPGDAWDNATVTLTTATTASAPITISFAPGSHAAIDQLIALIDAARRGEAPRDAVLDAGVPGLDFVAFDVETANGRWGSICQIGAAKVIDGAITETASWLCTPAPGLEEFDPFNVEIHGITAETVAGQPTFQERLAEFRAFVADLPLVAHNAQFDTTALREACQASDVEAPHAMFACTLAQSRASSLSVRDHKLPTIAAHLGVDLSSHHDAEADAVACAGIMVELARRAHHTGSLMEFVHSAGFTLGVLEPKRVIPTLRDRSGASRALQAKRVKNDESPAPHVSGAGTDQSTQPQQTTRRGPAPWQSVATPDTIPEPNEEADPSHILFGENVTLTGEFEPFDKGTLWAGIAQCGAQVGKNVTKKTTILVTGQWATMTSKEKRARELIDQGQELQIWSADKLLEALGLDEQPPF